MHLQDRNSRQDFGFDQIRESIVEANKISIVELFKSYGVPIDSWNKKACCPLSDHSGGKERTPSFYYYDETNSFYCFGCKAGGGPVEFISKLQDITRYKASLLLLEGFHPTTDGNREVGVDVRSIIEFSHMVRNFIKNSSSSESILFVEKFCDAFDDIRSHRDLQEKEYQKLILNIKTKLDEFSH